ncbi:MAG: saccharopine dehydrogenase NADP-binding domain-containing protein, partial [Halioglobus sp.]|nr:saccharopine dehydrogenase NADP-binding domain-containing protein [Halioglobus sp.]
MSEREFDVIVWGATGFTGKLVVEYLAETYGVGGQLRWAIAGRNRDKLEAVRRSLHEAQREQLTIIVAESHDAASLTDMVQRAQVICTTVGPYAKYGTPLVAACVDTGTHYCDLTGEVHWMIEMIADYQKAAEASGARILHTCGFDSVPFDVGVWHVQQLMRTRHGHYAQRVKGRTGKSLGAFSGGTAASIINMMEEARDNPAVMKQAATPYALYPVGVNPGQDGADQRGPVYDADFDQWTSPFMMAAINTRVVRRTNALLDFAWGPDFRYDEASLNNSRTKATLASAAAGMGMVLLTVGATRQLLQRLLPLPGEGPSREQREAGFYEVFFLAMDPTDRDKDIAIRVSGDLDPGYGSTSRMLGEAAACLAQDVLNVGGGFWTPAAAMGEKYLDRLTRNAGLKFEEVKSP